MERIEGFTLICVSGVQPVVGQDVKFMGEISMAPIQAILPRNRTWIWHNAHLKHPEICALD